MATIKAHRSFTVNDVKKSGKTLAHFIEDQLRDHPRKTLTVVTFDTETTGIDADAEITQCSFTIQTIRDKGVTARDCHPGRSVRAARRKDVWEYDEPINIDRFYRPARHESWAEASKVTGIYPHRTDKSALVIKDEDGNVTEVKRDLKSFDDPECIAEVQSIIDSADVICGHNVGFDISRIARWGVPGPSLTTIVDTMYDYKDYRSTIAFRDEMFRKNLTEAAGFFGYKFTAHNSMNDVGATCYLFNNLFKQDALTANSKKFTVNRYNKACQRTERWAATRAANLAAERSANAAA